MVTKERRTSAPRNESRSGAGEAHGRERRGVTHLLLALAAVGVVALAVVVITRRGDDGPGVVADADSSAVAARDQLLRTKAPWQPQTEGLQSRVEAAGFPPVGDESYHVHALLSVYVDGEQVLVPANVGLDPAVGFESPLHTHTPDGVIHIEADDPATFTLQQVFTIWGVEFTGDRLGGYTPAGDKRIHVYVNGERLPDASDYELQQGDNIVVAFGADGSFPTQPPDDALSGA